MFYRPRRYLAATASCFTGINDLFPQRLFDVLAVMTLSDAEDFLRRGEYGRCIQVLFAILQSPANPPLNRLEDSLVYSLDSLSSELILQGHTSKARWLWDAALGFMRGRSKTLFHAHSRFLCSQGDLLGALDDLNSCIVLDRNYTAAIDSAEGIKSMIVDRWHYRMLNDKQRNVQYKTAITRAIHSMKADKAFSGKPITVLDIGGGTGILSMYAAAAGADHVYCCEMSLPLAEVARRCIADNGFSDRITVISKHSTNLQIGMGSDLPERVSLVVTELVDSGLLGEKIIHSLRDARERLLVNNVHDGHTGRIIPYSATVYGVPIESDSIAASQRVQQLQVEDHFELQFGERRRTWALSDVFVNLAQAATNYLVVDEDRSYSTTTSSSSAAAKTTGGGAEEGRRCSGSWSAGRRRGPLGAIIVDERYTCEDISTFPLKMLAEPEKLLEIVLDGSESSGSAVVGSAATSGAAAVASFTATSSGQIDGFAYWYTLFLEPPHPSLSSSSTGSSSSISTDTHTNMHCDCDDAGGSVCISTEPGRAQCGWDQGIIYGCNINTAYSVTPPGNGDDVVTSPGDSRRSHAPGYSHISNHHSSNYNTNSTIRVAERDVLRFAFTHDDEHIYVKLDDAAAATTATSTAAATTTGEGRGNCHNSRPMDEVVPAADVDSHGDYTQMLLLASSGVQMDVVTTVMGGGAASTTNNNHNTTCSTVVTAPDDERTVTAMMEVAEDEEEEEEEHEVVEAVARGVDHYKEDKQHKDNGSNNDRGASSALKLAALLALGEMDIAMLNDTNRAAAYLFGITSALRSFLPTSCCSSSSPSLSLSSLIRKPTGSIIFPEQSTSAGGVRGGAAAAGIGGGGGAAGVSVLELSGNWHSSVLSSLILQQQQQQQQLQREHESVTTPISSTPQQTGGAKASALELAAALRPIGCIASARIACPSQQSADLFRQIYGSYLNQPRPSRLAGGAGEVSIDTVGNGVCKVYITEGGSFIEAYINRESSQEAPPRNQGESSADDDEEDGDDDDNHMDYGVAEEKQSSCSSANNGSYNRGGYNQEVEEEEEEEAEEEEDNAEALPAAAAVADGWGPFDVIICDLIEGCGLIRQNSLQELRMALQFMTNANRVNTVDQSGMRNIRNGVPRGAPPVLPAIVVPYAVTVVVALVECPHLLHHHWVDPENTLGVKVHQQINKYGSTHLRELDLTHMKDLRFLSDPVDAVTLTMSSLGNSDAAAIGIGSDDSSGSSGLVCSADVEVEASESGTAHALCFWFKLSMASQEATAATVAALQVTAAAAAASSTSSGRSSDSDSKVADDALNSFPRMLDTGPHVRCPRCASVPAKDTAVKASQRTLSCSHCTRRHWRQAAVLLKPPRVLDVGDVVSVEVGIDLSYGVVCRISD